MSKPNIDVLLDGLFSNSQLQREWELNPTEVAKRYELTESQLTALLDGDVDALLSEGLAERHVQQMRVSW
ncbi:hypothetical protein [Micromonospora sp. NPDC047074]|uniref:hypothetical protein n=1 Tax=Micromonospora sp. NPDC047074 TaxID=3154339 RepID=UPI0033C405E1